MRSVCWQLVEYALGQDITHGDHQCCNINETMFCCVGRCFELHIMDISEHTSDTPVSLHILP